MTLAAASLYDVWDDRILRQEVKDELERQSLILALERIQDMEERNVNFNSLSPLDRCLVFFRDSGLRDDECHERFGVPVHPVQ